MYIYVCALIIDIAIIHVRVTDQNTSLWWCLDALTESIDVNSGPEDPCILLCTLFRRGE